MNLENKPIKPVNVSLWIAITQRRAKPGKNGAEIIENEYRFLATHFADACGIAQGLTRDGEEIVDLRKASNIIETGDYWVLRK